MDINLELALRIIKVITTETSRDLEEKDGGPIAVTVIGANGKRIASASMDGVMPASIGLDENKAYTAVQGQRATLEWEEKGVDRGNFTDPRFTCFGGGVPIIVKGEVIGAIGVSGRHSSKKDLPKNAPPQDHELAVLGAKYLIATPY